MYPKGFRSRTKQAQKTTERRTALGPAALVLMLALLGSSACAERAAAPDRTAPSSPADPPGASPSEVADATPTTTAAQCAPPFGFAPGYLPPGFEAEPRPGSGGQQGVPLDEQSPKAAGHFTGDEARGFIDVTAGAPPYAQTLRRPINVLDSPGTIGRIHEGWSVEFAYEGCDYALLAYGVKRSQLARFAQGLEDR